MKIINIYYKEQIFHDDFFASCMQNAIKQVLDYYSVENSVLFLNFSLDIVFHFDQNSAHGFHYDTNYEQVVVPEFSKLIKARNLADGNDSKDLDEIKNFVNQGVPILLGVDPFYLPYFENHYNKIHNSHTVILAGYNDKEKNSYIIDWYYPYFFKGIIAYKDLFAARASKNPGNLDGIASGSPINNSWCEIDRNGWKADAEYLVHQIITLSLNQYYNYDAIDSVIGLAAIKKLYEVIKNKISTIQSSSKSNGELGNFLRYVHRQLYNIQTKKKIFCHYLKEAVKVINHENLKEAMIKMQFIANNWEKLVLYILKASIVSNNRMCEKIINMLKDLIDLEESYYNTLTKANSIFK